jgi:hypothetical protein
MAHTKELSFDQIEKILRSELINRSFIAEMMYPNIKSSSASGKLSNKLNRNGRFKFTAEEEKRAIRIVSREYFKLLE